MRVGYNMVIKVLKCNFSDVEDQLLKPQPQSILSANLALIPNLLGR